MVERRKAFLKRKDVGGLGLDGRMLLAGSDGYRRPCHSFVFGRYSLLHSWKLDLLLLRRHPELDELVRLGTSDRFLPDRGCSDSTIGSFVILTTLRFFELTASSSIDSSDEGII